MKFIYTYLLISFSLLNLTAQQLDTVVDAQPDSAQATETALSAALEQVKTPEINSPRATIQHFLNNINESHQLMMKTYELNLELPGFFIASELKNQVRQVELYFSKATFCLDLSRLPPSLQKDLGYGRAIMLKEILDRIELPSMDEIPDASAVDFDFENNKYPKLEYWQIPNTELILVRTEKGILKGQYVLSAESVEKLPILYKKVKHLPYKSDRIVTKGFYEFYISTPGTLVPPRWISLLPKNWNEMVYSQTIWQWLALVIAFISAALVVRLLYKLFIQVLKKYSYATKDWGRVLFYSLTIMIIVFLNNVINEQINITGNFLLVIKITLESIVWILISFVSFNILTAISETIVRDPNVARMGIEATFTRASFMVLATLVSIVIIIIGLSQIGVSIVPLLTGVGIGGLAIALAARSTLENVIASFTIFADKPYRVNERVKVMSYNGTIESIGIRSTQIRLLTGPLVSIPNEKMASVEIENIQKRPYLRQEFDIRIKYESTPEKLEQSIQIIKEILSVPNELNDGKHENSAINKEDYPPRVHFNKINNDSFNIHVIYWFFPPDWWEFLAHAEKINLKIIKGLNEASIDFAFPTQMLHLSDDVNISSKGDSSKKKL